jgi:hypothetical protein
LSYSEVLSDRGIRHIAINSALRQDRITGQSVLNVTKISQDLQEVGLEMP